DCCATLTACKRLWSALEPRQQVAAAIEAECIPLVADANLRGLLVDTIAAQDLILKLKAKAARLLASLEPHGVTEKIVRSPQQLATLLFDTWGLPIQKTNPP